MNTDTLTTVLLIAAALAAVGILAGGLMALQDFRKDLDYINREIARTTGQERRYWQRQKRRLWLSLLPFCRR